MNLQNFLNQFSHYPFGMLQPGRKYRAGSYRFGFNTQEQVDEIKGLGNHNTAKFWEYDTRLGRRLNLDMITKHWQSNYACFSNTPIWKIDPEGDDDFFNSTGTFSHRTNSGSKIYIQTDKGNILLSQLNLKSPNNRQVVADVVGFYAKQVGITYQSKGSKDNSRNGIVGLKANNLDSDNNPAFTEGNNIFINKKNNKISDKLDDLNNLKSVLTHEKTHKEKGHGFNPSSNYEHAEVYLNQISDDNFSKGTKDFQKGVLGSFSNYLKNSIINDHTQDSDVEDLISKANSALSKTGYNLVFDRYSMQPDAFNIKLNDSNKK